MPCWNELVTVAALCPCETLREKTVLPKKLTVVLCMIALVKERSNVEKSTPRNEARLGAVELNRGWNGGKSGPT